MARIFITGSSDGLGSLAARSLVEHGHHVVLHARNERRAEDALRKVPGAETVLTGDLTKLEETKQLAEAANACGPLDVVIHNAAVYRYGPDALLAVNVLSPYVLTCLINKPKRLVYLSSGMHRGGHPNLQRMLIPTINYSDSKLYIVLLMKAVARRWKEVYANALDPGWVPTKMGGPGAPDDLEKGFETQVWLAESDEEAVKVSGLYFHHKRHRPYAPAADDENLQEEFLNVSAQITGVHFPG